MFITTEESNQITPANQNQNAIKIENEKKSLWLIGQVLQPKRLSLCVCVSFRTQKTRKFINSVYD